MNRAESRDGAPVAVAEEAGARDVRTAGALARAQVRRQPAVEALGARVPFGEQPHLRDGSAVAGGGGARGSNRDA